MPVTIEGAGLLTALTHPSHLLCLGYWGFLSFVAYPYSLQW
ncbi:MAG: hypothetical protein QS721_11760 [Candidatus Endonucleobacter sp. (ex Gigantidas childressi)]|nr:hypothetical protein [Candidatus Endonucleobacter sp. (ex Gigantidas childressi)]